MKGKVAVITGALGALGKVVAEEALSRGARVAGIDHAASQLAATAQRIEFGRIDLTDAAQAKKAIDAAAAHFGAIDALINIAGGFTFETIADGDPKAWQRMHALNVETALNASRAAIPHLLNSRSARIVNIGAMGGLQAGSGMGPYAASKAGVHKLTESLAAELKGKITVNAVLPSAIPRQTAPACRRPIPPNGSRRRNSPMSSSSWRATPPAPLPARCCRSTDGSEARLRRYQLQKHSSAIGCPAPISMYVPVACPA
jgi:NAD(P)-dependent dehydrogenase (short-subunit alcohol dehydrogenase family)